MNDQHEHDPYRSPSAETGVGDWTRDTPGKPLPWDVIEAFRFAWEALKRFPISILAAFIVALVAGVLTGIGSVVQNLSTLSRDSELEALGWVVYGATALLNIPIAAWIQLGFARFTLAMARGTRPEFGVLFRTDGAMTAVLVQLLITVGMTLLMGALMGPGGFLFYRDQESVLALVLLGVGGMIGACVAIYFGVRLSYVAYAVADGERGVSEAIGRSWRLTDGIFWRLILFAVLAVVLAMLGLIVGACALCIGLIVTIPAVQVLANVATAYGFLHQKGERPRPIPPEGQVEPATN